MSIKYTSWAFDQDINSPGLKFVLVALCDCADHDGDCFPKIETIAKMTGQHRKTISRHLKSLEKIGYITKKRTKKSNGHFGRNNYEIHKDKKICSPRDNLPHGKMSHSHGSKCHIDNYHKELSSEKRNTRKRDNFFDGDFLDEELYKWAKEQGNLTQQQVLKAYDRWIVINQAKPPEGVKDSLAWFKSFLMRSKSWGKADDESNQGKAALPDLTELQAEMIERGMPENIVIAWFKDAERLSPDRIEFKKELAIKYLTQNCGSQVYEAIGAGTILSTPSGYERTL